MIDPQIQQHVTGPPTFFAWLSKTVLAVLSLLLVLTLSSCQFVAPEPSNIPLIVANHNDAFQPDSGADRLLETDNPVIQIQNYDPVSTGLMIGQFEALGFEAPDLYALQSLYPPSQTEFTLNLPPMTFMMFREGGWEKSALLQTVRDLPKRYAACGIGVSDIMIVETSMPPVHHGTAGGLNFDVLQVDNYNRLAPLISRLPVNDKPLFFFVGSVFSDQYQDSVGGFAANVFTEFGGATLPQLGRPSPIAQTGAIARRPVGSDVNYQFDQTISHEIGHLLGLQHSRTGSGQDIMRPVTCKDCDFSPRQCATMRESRLLVRTTR